MGEVPLYVQVHFSWMHLHHCNALVRRIWAILTTVCKASSWERRGGQRLNYRGTSPIRKHSTP